MPNKSVFQLGNWSVPQAEENNVLTDFFTTRVYDKKRSFKVTTSPSMDILVSSNLERLIFHLVGNDATKTKELMESLVATGQYQLSDFDADILDLFAAACADEAETAAEIEAGLWSVWLRRRSSCSCSISRLSKIPGQTGMLLKRSFTSTTGLINSRWQWEAVTGRDRSGRFRSLGQIAHPLRCSCATGCRRSWNCAGSPSYKRSC